MDEDKRYQVFVSSTYLDLQEARAAVVSALLNLDAIPAGMELFPAADDDAWTLIEDVIADSDYYLLIIGGKYGSVDPELEISFTEREYETALRLKKPVMAFLHGSPGKLLAEQTEDSDVRREKLASFRKKVEREKHVKYWSSSEDLAGKVALTWNSFRRRYPAVGWVKANQVTSKESLAALASAHRNIEELKAQLLQVRTQAPPGTETLAQGEAKFSLPVYAYGRWQEVGGKYMNPARVGDWIAVTMTWNRVFGYLGLRMMQEADEPTLESDLITVVKQEHNDKVKSLLREAAKQVADGVHHRAWFDGVEVADEDFQTILLQLNALGLIEHSTRNRSVKDTANYWALTPYGHTQLVQLRALQSGQKDLLRLELEDPESEDTVGTNDDEESGADGNDLELQEP